MQKLSKKLLVFDKKELFTTFVRIVEYMLKLKRLGDQELNLLYYIHYYDDTLTEECWKHFVDDYKITYKTYRTVFDRIKKKGYLVQENGYWRIIRSLRVGDSGVELCIRLCIDDEGVRVKG